MRRKSLGETFVNRFPLSEHKRFRMNDIFCVVFQQSTTVLSSAPEIFRSLYNLSVFNDLSSEDNDKKNIKRDKETQNCFAEDKFPTFRDNLCLFVYENIENIHKKHTLLPYFLIRQMLTFNMTIICFPSTINVLALSRQRISLRSMLTVKYCLVVGEKLQGSKRLNIYVHEIDKTLVTCRKLLSPFTSLLQLQEFQWRQQVQTQITLK
ncbi:CLUMA_CG000883, isoform A [Clunio marinus]|uniref:CLUMA_CG000883, isoform A n=1 Tax=Clunio marinus TaxID=568069 RepID=A0A1J1HGC5_9DIPT|nr:CLUMA_CG000883, isoform A [Clunio marinus]